jgi:hypothetical protein
MVEGYSGKDGRGEKRDERGLRYDRKRWWGTSHASMRGTCQAGEPAGRAPPLPEEMRSLGYPAKNNLRGTIAILKGSLASRHVPFFRKNENGPSG